MKNMMRTALTAATLAASAVLTCAPASATPLHAAPAECGASVGDWLHATTPTVYEVAADDVTGTVVAIPTADRNNARLDLTEYGEKAGFYIYVPTLRQLTFRAPLKAVRDTVSVTLTDPECALGGGIVTGATAHVYEVSASGNPFNMRTGLAVRR